MHLSAVPHFFIKYIIILNNKLNWIAIWNKIG